MARLDAVAGAVGRRLASAPKERAAAVA